MRILHTSDWHIGINLHSMPMLREQEHFINNMLDIIMIDKIDAVIISGDVFDSSVSGSDAIALYTKAMTTICGDMNIPVVIIAGNHDGAARLAACRELLKKTGLYITGKLSVYIEPVCLGNTMIYSIPYFNIDEARSLFPNAQIKNYEDAMNAVCNSIREHMDASKTNIAVAHAFIGGAELSDSDRSASIGTINKVSKDVFDGFSYVALGHLHKAQAVGDNHIRYSGSPIKYSFGEAKRHKSVTIFDTDDMSIFERELSPIHDMRILRGEYNQLLNAAEYSEDYIKIELTDEYASNSAFDIFREIYPNLLVLIGKSMTDKDSVELTTLTADEIESFSPVDLLKKFLWETCGMNPTEAQIKMFEAALHEETYETNTQKQKG